MVLIQEACLLDVKILKGINIVVVVLLATHTENIMRILYPQGRDQ